MHAYAAKAARESNMLIRGHDLVAKEDDAVIEERLVDRGEGFVVLARREVDAGDFGTQGT